MMKYIYESHMGGIYIANEEFDYEDLYCEDCGDSDMLIGAFDDEDKNSIMKEFFNLLDGIISYRAFDFLGEVYGTDVCAELFPNKLSVIIDTLDNLFDGLNWEEPFFDVILNEEYTAELVPHSQGNHIFTDLNDDGYYTDLIPITKENYDRIKHYVIHDFITY